MSFTDTLARRFRRPEPRQPLPPELAAPQPRPEGLHDSHPRWRDHLELRDAFVDADIDDNADLTLHLTVGEWRKLVRQSALAKSWLDHPDQSTECDLRVESPEGRLRAVVDIEEARALFDGVIADLAVSEAAADQVAAEVLDKFQPALLEELEQHRREHYPTCTPREMDGCFFANATYEILQELSTTWCCEYSEEDTVVLCLPGGGTVHFGWTDERTALFAENLTTADLKLFRYWRWRLDTWPPNTGDPDYPGFVMAYQEAKRRREDDQHPVA